jgi:hypothetical protein
MLVGRIAAVKLLPGYLTEASNEIGCAFIVHRSMVVAYSHQGIMGKTFLVLQT